MTENVPVVAVTNVTFDGRRYRPGTRFELPAPCAHALTAAGNVRAAEAEHPDDETGEVEGAGRVATAPPAPAAMRPNRSHADTGGRPLEEISGIGPSTAEQLREAGVADVAALAGLSDEQLEELRVRASWREQARAMASGDASADDRPAAT